MMLELDVLEQRHLNPLESSLSRTVTHRWSGLRVPFIHELQIGPDPSPTSDPGDLDQIALHVTAQEAHCSLTEISEDTKVIPELLFCARKKETRELFSVNSAVMLDTVEKASPMEICDSAPNMMNQESGESSNLQIREDFLEISLAHDHTSQLNMRDGHIVSDPVRMNAKTAGMEVMGTGAVLQSEQSESVGNLPNEPNGEERPDLEISSSVGVLPETGSIAATETHTSPIEGSPGGLLPDECTALMSSSPQCTTSNTGDSAKCLEVEHLPHLQSTSTQRTFQPVDFPKAPTSFHKASVCKEQGFSCMDEVRSAICLLKPNTADDINGPQKNEPEDKDLDMSMESVNQETETTSSGEKQNDLSVTYPSKTTSAETESTRLQSNTSNVGLQLNDKFVIENDSTSPGTLEDELSYKPHLPPCLENVTSAKTLDTEECSSSSSMSDCNTPLSNGAPDCQKYTCANKLEDGSDSRSHSTLCPDALTSVCGDPSYARSARSSPVGCIETSYIDCNPRNRDTEPDGETEEQFMSVAPSDGLDRNVRITETNLNAHFLPVKTEDNQCSIAQLPLSDTTGKQGLCDMIPAVVDDTHSSLKIAEDSHSLVSNFELSDSNTVFHKIPNSDQSMTPPSRMQSNVLIEMKETVLTSNYLTVPCQTVGYRTNETPSYALVPYVDIWDSLSKSEINSLSSLREPINVLNKTCQSQEFKKDADDSKGSVKEGTLLEEPADVSMEDDCMLNAFKNPVDGLSLYSGKYKDGPVVDAFSKMGTLLAQEVPCNVSLNSFTCRSECHSIKMFENRASSMPPTIIQLENMCHFTSAALCDSSVALDVNNMPGFPQLGDNRRANICFLKEKCVHRLSTSHQHLDDCSALSLPTSSPISEVALYESKNSLSEVLGSSRLHVPSHADPSVPRLDGLIQGTELSATLKETLYASDSVQILAADINGPAQRVRPPVLGANRSLLMLHVGKPSPVKSVVSIKTKAARVKSQRNVLNAEIKIHEKLMKECQSLKERTGQSAGCQMKMRGTAENRKQYNLRPAPQSLNCSTSQEAKRPKIFHGNDIPPVNSGPLTCVDKFSQKSESHRPSQPRRACNRKEPPSDIRHSSLDTNVSVKRQPHRKCKSFVTQETLPIVIKAQTCKSFPVLKTHNSHDINVGYKSLPAKHVDLNLTSKLHYSKLTKGGALRPTHLLKSNQDQLLLTKLSKIANRLTAPSKSETFSNNLKVVPFRGVKVQARKLLNVFSCVGMRMNFQPGQIWQENVCLTSSRDRLVSQSMNLYPKAYFSGLGDAFSLNTCDNLTFPVSFHVNVDPSCLSDFLKFSPPDFILRSPQTTAQSSELSEWTLSLFLSSHAPADAENIHLLTQWNPEFRSLESSSESSHTRKALRKSGCSMLGLHTVLALSSPGCYRLWTRRRNLGSRIPTVQKLLVTQFAHGLKGSQPQLLRAKDQFSSLAFSLGRVLSTWSQHGLSAYSSDCANTHPNCSVLLPSQSSNSTSVCRSPNALVCVPQLPLNTISQLNTYSLPVQNLNLEPSICHQEYLGLPFSLSAQQKADPRSLCWLSSPYKNDVDLSNCSFRHEEVPKHSFIFSNVKKRTLNLPLDPSTQHKNNLERPLGFSSLKHDLKPVVKISLLKDQDPTVCLDSHCDVSIQKDAAVDLPGPESSPKGQACPFEQRENMFLPSTQSQKEDLRNEKGSFERRPQRVSQIRIRKTIPKPDPNLTPMGLPKPKRVNKKEFSLEDIYTNKNYKSPPPARSLETIFEEPKEKNGVLISVSQQKRKRILEFRDCTVPRLKRPKGKVKVMTSCKRGRKAAMEGVQLDALLIQKLMDLDNCLMEEEAMERDSAVSKMPS